MYLLATLLIGLPIMIAELTLGRAAKADAITTFVKLAPRRSAWWVIGLLGVICAYLIMGFYSKWPAGSLLTFSNPPTVHCSSSPQATGAAFDALIHNPWQALLWQWLVLLVIGGC